MPSIHLHSGQEGVERREVVVSLKWLISSFWAFSISIPYPQLKIPRLGWKPGQELGAWIFTFVISLARHRPTYHDVYGPKPNFYAESQFSKYIFKLMTMLNELQKLG